ncbi:MAG: hypothetical protein HW416_708 [Chloroflexi bacterium]|nr:hypothetical protein [Chloroflexota bacterium]
MTREGYVLSLLCLAIAVAVSISPVQSQNRSQEEESAGPSVAGGGEFRTVDESAATPNSAELALWQLVNADRVRNGLPELAYDAELITVARVRARDQVTQPQLSHSNGNGQLAYMTLIQEMGLFFSVAGENVVRVFGPATEIAQRAEDMLMGSPTHRAVILEPRFESMAVGSVVDPSGSVVFTQIFRAS